MIGMLWFDNDPKKAVRAKIIEAADYYRQKYGQVPNYCEVSPQILESEMKIGILTARPSQSIHPNHFWIGRKENDPANKNNEERTCIPA